MNISFKTWLLVAAAAVCGGCSPLDLNKGGLHGFAAAPLVHKVCDSTPECAITVRIRGVVNGTCAIRTADVVVLLGTGVQTLSWTIIEDIDAKYRFKGGPLPSPTPTSAGIAIEDNNFSRTNDDGSSTTPPSSTRMPFVAQAQEDHKYAVTVVTPSTPPYLKSFKFSVYIESLSNGVWGLCGQLDPIIVSHE